MQVRISKGKLFLLHSPSSNNSNEHKWTQFSNHKDTTTLGNCVGPMVQLHGQNQVLSCTGRAKFLDLKGIFIYRQTCDWQTEGLMNFGFQECNIFKGVGRQENKQQSFLPVKVVWQYLVWYLVRDNSIVPASWKPGILQGSLSNRWYLGGDYIWGWLYKCLTFIKCLN